MSKLPSVVAVAACSFANTFITPAIAALVLPLVLGAAPAWADGTPVRVRGTVVSLDGSKLVVHAKDGKDVTVSLKDKYAALAVVKSSMEDIKQGTFIGTATVATARRLAARGRGCGIPGKSARLRGGPLPLGPWPFQHDDQRHHRR